MTFQTLKCPECGASLDVDQSMSFGVCPYCKTKFQYMPHECNNLSKYDMDKMLEFLEPSYKNGVFDFGMSIYKRDDISTESGHQECPVKNSSAIPEKSIAQRRMNVDEILEEMRTLREQTYLLDRGQSAFDRELKSAYDDRPLAIIFNECSSALKTIQYMFSLLPECDQKRKCFTR